MSCGPVRACPICSDTFTGSGCGRCGVTIDPVTGECIPTPGICAPGTGNLPLSNEEYQNSIGVCLQDVVDEARRLEFDLGMRPYRVVLKWLRRNRDQRFVEEIRSLELTPHKISTFTGVDIEVQASGYDEIGDIVLSQVSPTQVGFDDLIGKIDDKDPDPDTNFFYEITQLTRCVGERPIPPGRYTPTSIPSFDAQDFGWSIVLRTQQQRRSATPDENTPDRDQTFKPSRLPRRPRSPLRT